MRGQKEQTKMKKYRQSIGARLRYDINILMGVSILALVVLAVVLSFASTLGTLKKALQTTAAVTADRVAMELEITKTLTSEIGLNEVLYSDKYTEEQKQIFINAKVEDYELTRGKFIGSNGICGYDGTDYSDRDYFQRAMQGETVVSDPVVAKTDGKLSIIIASPVWANGEKDSQVIGVVFVVPDTNFLNNIMADIKVSKNASTYMINSSGITIAHTNPSVAQAQENTIEMAETDSSLKRLASLERKMMQGESGYGIYWYGGDTKLLAYAPVSGTNGWSVATSTLVNDFLGTLWVCIILMLLLGGVALAIGANTARVIGKVIGTPIKQCAERLVLLAEGDLHSPMPEIDSEDETHILAEATGMLANSLRIVIEDTDYVLQELAQGNFTAESQKEDAYIGDFHGLIVSIQTLVSKLDVTLKGIQEVAEQVSLGSDQLSQSAQELAEGATDQAGAVEELQATIINLTGIVENNEKSLQDSYQLAKKYQEQAVSSGGELKNLKGAMERIIDAAGRMNNFIEEIEDIAAQTNLLSLNASIEAARAGEAGRGFTVVAEQIRKLADESAVSAVHIRELIAKTLQEIENGNEITDRTFDSMTKVVNGMDVLAGESQKAMDNSTIQSEAMGQIEEGIGQISGVVQSNSAAAEEASATSEELSAQATNMNEMVGRFKLR